MGGDGEEPNSKILFGFKRMGTLSPINLCGDSSKQYFWWLYVYEIQ